MEAVETQVLVAAQQDVVWWAWTRAERITQWFAPAARIEPHPGGAFELFFNPADRTRDCTAGCTLTAVEPMTRLGFTWKGPDQFAAVMNDPDRLTTVSVTFEPAEGGTRVTVTHTGWGEGEAWAEARNWHVMAWRHVLDSLKGALESGKGDLCCAPPEHADD
ncbi:SRPBCC family protein [Symbiobacterium terraclitae]|uniref:SRPBCC family protein n=1 Tax=Symbiobacterium terraclitae TaxID=557451 RepID=UPI0035B51493